MTRKPNNLKRNVFLIVIGLISLYFLFTLNKNKMETSPKNMENQNSKKEGALDKILFGLLIGGAIGSVLGLTVAPDKGKKTRQELKKKGAELLSDEMVASPLISPRKPSARAVDVMSVVTNKSKGIVSFFTSRIFGSEQKGKEGEGVLDWVSDMEKIPSEAEEEVSQ